MKFAALLLSIPFVITLTLPAPAQNALQDAFNKCLDTTRPADEQIRYCSTLVTATGLSADESAFAYVDLGMAYQRKGNDDDALAAYTKAINLEPNLWQALVDRAFLYLNRGEFDSAFGDYNRIVGIDPNAVKMFRQDIGDYQTLPSGATTDYSSGEREQSEHDTAIATLKTALVQAMTYRCSARGKSGALESALSDCEQALKLDPGFAPALASHGFVEFRLNDLQASITDFDAAAKAAPQDAGILYMRGIVRQRMGDAAGAKADMTAAEQIDPAIATKFMVPAGGAH